MERGCRVSTSVNWLGAWPARCAACPRGAKPARRPIALAPCPAWGGITSLLRTITFAVLPGDRLLARYDWLYGWKQM
jgi:hypothetical protein